MESSSDMAELAKQKRFVELLADETNLPIEEVEPVYSEVLARLKERAEIPDFAPIFAWRKTRALLTH